MILEDENDEAPFQEQPPEVKLVAGVALCGEHGRRQPWIVCAHLEAVLSDAALGTDYRLYRVIWLYDGVRGASTEYRLCHACAATCGLTAERVDVERATERVQEIAVCICSGCGLSRLRPPSKKPLVIQTDQ